MEKRKGSAINKVKGNIQQLIRRHNCSMYLLCCVLILDVKWVED